MGDFVVHMAVARHPVTHEVHEVALTSSAKPGTTFDLILADLTVALSRAIQRRNPVTGETLS